MIQITIFLQRTMAARLSIKQENIFVVKSPYDLPFDQLLRALWGYTRIKNETTKTFKLFKSWSSLYVREY